MVLAAGFGTRLEPLTATRAKVVVPFLNRPLLDYTLDWLRRCGFDEVVINLHHLPETVRRRYRDEAFGLRIHYHVEESILGTAGGPRAVLDRLGDRVLIVNGDIVGTVAPGPLWNHHEGSGALATMALYAGSGSEGYPQIGIDDSGRVTHIPGVTAGELPAGSRQAGCFTGLHIVERGVLETIPEGRFCGMVDPIYGELMNKKLPLHALVVPGVWYEIGTPARYLSCQLEALRREDLPLAFGGYRRIAPSGYVGRRVGWERAGLSPPYMLDDQTQVEKGALVEATIAGARSFIGAGATVRNSVLMERAWVGAGARIEGCIVLEDAVVPAAARLVDEVVAPVPVGQVG
jgi:NDP-sugar pyrophosphorylase family protein